MENIQKKLTEKLLSSDIARFPVSLFHGKMGLCIYFYHMSKNESNPEYQSIADRLLDQILLHDLSPNHPIDVENGLAGIGLGVTYLIKNRFVEGDLNELLEVIDSAIYRKIAFIDKQSNIPPTVLLHLTGYLYVRLKEQSDTNYRELYQDLIIKVLNMLYDRIDDEFLSEPFSFSIRQYQVPLLLWIISKLLEADFYSDRIYRMLDTLQLQILSRFPMLHANRLFLLWGILHLKPCLKHKSWDNYIGLLYREISVDEILDREMTDRKIFIDNGLSGIYILLHLINSGFPDYPIPFDPQTIEDKIQNSSAWNAMLERGYFCEIHQGLLSGFPGVQFVLEFILG